MINSTSYGERGIICVSPSFPVSTNKTSGRLNSIPRRLLFLTLLVLFCSAGSKTFAFTTTYYYPVSATAGAGGTYCTGAPASNITGSIGHGSASATGGSSSTVTWSWYYNTTGATGTLTGATLAFTGTTYTASSTAPVTANLPGTSISTATPGTYYYFLYVSFAGGTYGAGTLFSGLSTVVVNATPTALTGPSSVCIGSTITLSESATGGTWGSSSTGVATVSTTGVVTPIGVGITLINYTSPCGTVSMPVTVNPAPAPITGPGAVCEGGASITLNSADAGGTWSSGLPTTATALTFGTNDGLITGITAGTATISYVNALSCLVTRVVTVNPLPGPILGTLTACTGNNSVLSDAIPGGTWMSTTTPVATIDPASGLVSALDPGTTLIIYTNGCGADTVVFTSVGIPAAITSYADSACVGASTVFADVTVGGTWSSSNPGVANILTSTDGIINGVGAGTATITYTIPPGCYNTRVVTINPIPPAITSATGSFALCPGTTIDLNDAATAGSWRSLRTIVATVAPATGIVTGIGPTGVVPDTATIVFTSNKGCYVTKVVTVNPAPVPITGNNIPCGLSVDTLYDGTPGGTWSSSDAGVATIGSTTGIITTHAGGTVRITYTLPVTGCYAIKILTVNPAPSPSLIYNTTTNTFYTDTFYDSYQWYNDAEGQILGAVSFRTAGLYTGNYWVIVVDSNGCVGRSGSIYFFPVEVKNTTATNIHIYPNPSSGVVNIESSVKLRAVVSGIDGKTEMDVADAKQLNIGGLANGMYIISLYNDAGDRLLVQKLIKQ